MKDKLVELVMQKTGLQKQQAEQAVDVVEDFLSKQMPAPVGPAIKQFVKDGQTKVDPGQVSNIAGWWR